MVERALAASGAERVRGHRRGAQRDRGPLRQQHHHHQRGAPQPACGGGQLPRPPARAGRETARARGSPSAWPAGAATSTWRSSCGPARPRRPGPRPPRTPSPSSARGLVRERGAPERRAAPAGPETFDEAPVPTSPAVLGAVIAGLGGAFERARAAGNRLAGFATHGVETVYLGTSTGLRLRHVQPAGTMELVARSADGARSVWAGAAHRDLRRHRHRRLRGPPRPPPDVGAALRRPPAGRYEVLLPPDATADLMVAMSQSLSGRDAEEGRSPFSAPGGGTRVGEALCPLPFSLRGDPHEPGLESAPVPRERGVGDRRLGVRQRPPPRRHRLDRRRPTAPAAVPPGRGGAVGGRARAAGRQPDPRPPRARRRRSTT